LEPTEIFGKDYEVFSETDPYNPSNTVSGFLCHKSTELYGALLITAVNGRAITPQLVMATPKIHYPFDSRDDGTRNYHFPRAKTIQVYEKLDGTNVLAYFYVDHNGIKNFTFKTRLRPFIGNSRFGEFLNMWNEIAQPYFPHMRRLMEWANCNLSFELYGSRNPHLVIYKEPIAFALLFGVTNEAKIIPPLSTLRQSPHRGDYPDCPLLKTIDKDYVWNYETTQKELEARLVSLEDGKYAGLEGTVWYLQTEDNHWIQFKCKPETIETIHFSAGAGGLSRNIVLATTWNSLENTDAPTVELVKKLLTEEFSPETVNAKTDLIASCVEFVVTESAFRKEVLDCYKAIGKNVLLEKTAVMRDMGQHFPRNKMGKVYSIIANQ